MKKKEQKQSQVVQDVNIGDFVCFVFKDHNGKFSTVTQKITHLEDLNAGNTKFYVKCFINADARECQKSAMMFITDELQNKTQTPREIIQSQLRPEDVNSFVQYADGSYIRLVPFSELPKNR